MDGACFRSPHVLVHSGLHIALSGMPVWSVIKNKIVLILNITILAVSLLSSQAFWVPSLSPLKIMVLLMSLNRFQTHCTYYSHSWPTGSMTQLSITAVTPLGDSTFSSNHCRSDGSSCWKTILVPNILPCSKIRAGAGSHLSCLKSGGAKEFFTCLWFENS